MSSNKIKSEENQIKNESEKKPKVVMRGKARAAALLANLKESEANSCESSTSSSLFSLKKPSMTLESNGIYSNMLKITKKKLEETKKKFEIVDKNIIESASKNLAKNVAKYDSSNDESTDLKSSANSDLESCSPSDSESSSIRQTRKKTKTRSRSDSSTSPPPPPPPSSHLKDRKPLTAFEKELKELEKIKNITSKNIVNIDSPDSLALNDQNHIEIDNTITVRVSTKTGIQKWEINKSDQFLKIFQNLSVTEKTSIENLKLIFKERIINFNDTPITLNLKPYSIIFCEKIKGKCQEKIKIVENEDESENISPNMTYITLQTQEGRKSRIKFLIFKDEPFVNVLKKYCEKREFENSHSYMMEFDGDVVGPTDTASSLDLDGDEIFDVKKSNKPTMQTLKENKTNYEFDDDILIA